jgi:hypothetical protein
VHSPAEVRRSGPIVALAVVALAGCGPHHAAGTPAPATTLAAAFVAAGGPAELNPVRVVATSSDPTRCLLAGRFEGIAYPRDSQLEVVVPRGWVAVTRNNDKRWDYLHLTIELGGPRPIAGQLPTSISRSVKIVLEPTVDTAAASVTTWQASDTLYLFLPWARTPAPRRLLFWVRYHAIGFSGNSSVCDVMMTSDTLRFTAPSAAR